MWWKSELKKTTMENLYKYSSNFETVMVKYFYQAIVKLYYVDFKGPSFVRCWRGALLQKSPWMQRWRGSSPRWAGPGSWQYEFHQYLTRTTHAVQPLSMASGPQSPSGDPLIQIKWRAHSDENHTLKKKALTNWNSRGRIHRCQRWRHLWWPFLCSLSTLRCELSATSTIILIVSLTTEQVTSKPTEQKSWTRKHKPKAIQLCTLLEFGSRDRSLSSSQELCWRLASHPCHQPWWVCWSGFSEPHGAQRDPLHPEKTQSRLASIIMMIRVMHSLYFFSSRLTVLSYV